ncbi:CsbD family protein [Rhodopila sp.]|uniref:CsbD family protein n=1 Tax=Rhodopila sp. TaxID=2480087 RepID=UPI003D0E5AF9
MDKDRKAGIGKKISGFFKEATGKVTGDSKTQTEGAAEQTAGKTQNAVGGAKDAMRDTLSRRSER